MVPFESINFGKGDVPLLYGRNDIFSEENAKRQVSLDTKIYVASNHPSSALILLETKFI